MRMITEMISDYSYLHLKIDDETNLPYLVDFSIEGMGHGIAFFTKLEDAQQYFEFILNNYWRIRVVDSDGLKVLGDSADS